MSLRNRIFTGYSREENLLFKDALEVDALDLTTINEEKEFSNKLIGFMCSGKKVIGMFDLEGNASTGAFKTINSHDLFNQINFFTRLYRKPGSDALRIQYYGKGILLMNS